MPELIEPVSSTSQENSVQLENNPPSEINISVQSDVSTDPKNIALKDFLCFLPSKKIFYQK